MTEADPRTGIRQAVVLAGGLGTRLRALVRDVPKPMAPVAERPFLEWLLLRLSRQGVERVVLSVGYLSHTIAEHFGVRFAGLDLGYEIEDRPLGTGGALRAALRRCADTPTLVLNGDTWLSLDLRELSRAGQLAGRSMIVGCTVPDCMRYGRLRIADDLLEGFEEKGVPGPGVANTGHYLLRPNLFDGVVLPERFSFETDFLQPRVATLGLGAFRCNGVFVDIGVPEDFQRAQTEIPLYE